MNRRGALTVVAGVLFIYFTTVVGEADAQCAPREQYPIPLVRLTLKADEQNGQEFIRIYDSDFTKYAEIGQYSDKIVQKNDGNTTVAESYSNAHLLSDLEKKQMQVVIESFEKTLLIFQKDLEGKRDARLRYLDAYFPRFLQNFYGLSILAFANTEMLPEKSFVADFNFEVSEQSPKTDRRIASWDKIPEHRIKLGVAAKELAFQLKNWEKTSDRDTPKGSICSYSKELRNAFELFIRFYFVVE